MEIKIRNLAEMVELNDMLLNLYGKEVQTPKKVGVTGDFIRHKFVLDRLKPLGEKVVYAERLADWEKYCGKLDEVEILDVATCLLALESGMSFEDVEMFLRTRSSDIFYGIAEVDAIALFSKQGPEFFRFFHDTDGWPFESPIYKMTGNSEDKKTLEDIEKENAGYANGKQPGSQD